MHLNVILALFCFLTIGHVFVNGASTAPPPPASSAAPASSPPPASSAAPDDLRLVGAGDIGLMPGAPDLTSCSGKRPCPDKNSQCIDGRCICNEGFAPGGNDTCIKAPGLGDRCRVRDQEFSCSGIGVEFQCPNNSICTCRAGYEPDSTSKENCKPATRLVGAACKIDGDCTAAFTTCQSAKCACISGFKPADKGSLCTPTGYNCLNSDKALEAKGSVVLCELSIDPETGDIGNDSCPTTHFCNTWQNTISTSRQMTGHCCPKPAQGTNITATCPVGVPHATGLCPDYSKLPADAPLPTNLGPLCPLGDGYDCIRGNLCCPLACRSSNSFININGKCYDSVIMKQPCELDAQCLPNAACTKGTCQCNTGFTEATSTFCLANGSSNPFGPSP